MSEVNRRIKQFINSKYFMPLALVALVFISYGLLIKYLGFYLDDWYILWYKDAFGAAKFIQYFALDRPLEGYYFYAVNFLAGNSISPLVWQIITLSTHALSVLAIWSFLVTLWPNHKRQTSTVALLAAVYPGFTQSSMIQYSFHFFCLACLFFSFTLMLKAMNQPKYFWIFTFLSVVLGVYAYAGADFFAGLELIRPIILWIAFSRLHQDFKSKFRTTLLNSIPYAVSYIGFFIWRSFFYVSENHQLAINVDMLKSPVQLIMNFMLRTWQAGVDAVINAWGKVFNLQYYPRSGMVWTLIIVLVLVLFAVFWFIFRQFKTDSEDTELKRSQLWRKEALWLSIGALLVTVIPFWAADLQIGIENPYDRFLLSYLFGSCLFVAALLETHGKFQKINLVLVCLLIAFGTGNQIANSNRFKNQWTNQKELYWQIVWRMPELTSGTTLWTYQFPENAYYTGAALGSQLNWTYSGTGIQKDEIDYDFILINSGQSVFVPVLVPNQSIVTSNRKYEFHGNTSNTVYVYKESNNCLRVLDDQLTPILTVVADYNRTMIEASSLSNLGLIGSPDGKPAQPIYAVYGPEPTHDWCYYFEKAELARQQQKYSEVVDLFAESQNLGLTPNSITEWYPFIEALGRTGRWEEVEKLTQLVVVDSRIAVSGLCNIWDRFAEDSVTDASLTSKINEQKILLGCD